MKPAAAEDPAMAATASSTSSDLASAMAGRGEKDGEKLFARAGESAEENVLVEGGQDSVLVERRGDFNAVCKWTIGQFGKVKAKTLWSKYFEVGGYDCRILVYPRGDSQALPGYLSIYLQVMDPRGSSSSKWDCFASYRLCIVNQRDQGKSVFRDSWHRFSAKKKCHGWCDFSPSSAVLDPKGGFLVGDSVVVMAEIMVLQESVTFCRDGELQAPMPEVLSGKFSWKVHNFALFKEMIKTQKIMSPVFPAGECNLRLSVYQSTMNGVEYLSMCLESKDSDKTAGTERSCWCLFRMSVLNQMGLNHMQRDSYGRFAADNKGGDNTSLGWNDYMPMADFLNESGGYLDGDTAVFSASFHVIKESCSFSRNLGAVTGRISVRKSDGHQGKFTWRIENFTRLKDILKKRKITGLCIKSRRFQVGNRDCRLIVYPRGQSQPPCHLSMFLEVTDPRNNSADWSCFVSHRLSVVNQKYEEKSVTKESQNRYSKAAKDWGWREFITLTTLFDQDSGFLMPDTVVFSAEVLILKETCVMFNTELNCVALKNDVGKFTGRGTFTWKVENFLAFKEIMETRKIFSKYFQAGGCELRIGVYESFDTLCIYLESDQSGGVDPEKNFWVRYRMAVLNQKCADKTIWKESSICTKTWNNSVLQFMKVPDMVDADAGFLVRDSIIFVCEIQDCCPWFEFSDLEVMVSDDEENDALSTDPDELDDSEASERHSVDEEDIFRSLLSRAGFHLTYGDTPPLLLDPSQLQVTLRKKLWMDAGAIAAFLTGLKVYLDDPAKVKQLLVPTKVSATNLPGKSDGNGECSSPSVMNLLMGVKVLQQAIVDLLLDIMVECCQTLEDKDSDAVVEDIQNLGKAKEEVHVQNETTGAVQNPVDQSQNICDGVFTEKQASNTGPSETCKDVNSSMTYADNQILKSKCSEQSDELLRLIINSLRGLDGVVPQGSIETHRQTGSIKRISFVLEKSPKHLKADFITIVPNLVDASENSLAAYMLLSQLRKPDSDPDLWAPILGSLSQLNVSHEMWEQVLSESLRMLTAKDEGIHFAAISCIFKAASPCQQLLHAASAVRKTLKTLGVAVSTRVLDSLRKIISSQIEVADAFLKDIDNDIENVEKDFTKQNVANFGIDDVVGCSGKLQFSQEPTATACPGLVDVYILVQLLAVKSCRIEAQKLFERAISRGCLSERSVSVFLERMQMENHALGSRSLQVDSRNHSNLKEDADFSSVIELAEALLVSCDSRVREFVYSMYVVIFKLCKSTSYRDRMLKGLVNRAAGNVHNGIDLCIDILVFLVREDEGTARTVLNMMREAVHLVNIDRTSLWQRLQLTEQENVRVQKERQGEIEDLCKDKAVLSQKLAEALTIQSHLKAEMKSELERFSRERKDLTERLQEAENQLEWVRAEHAEEVAKFVADKKSFQDQLRDVETELSQLKTRKRDELKRVVKEKNVLAGRLKSAEAARKRYDEELKRFATETVSREEVRQSLEAEIKRLRKTVGQTEGGLREKEKQVKQCEDYIDGMEAKLAACQSYIQSLEQSLQEEISRHAPLYGAGLDLLTVSELETLARIHEEGFRQVGSMLQQRNSGSEALLPITPPLSLYGSAPSFAMGMPPVIVNGAGIHSNGHLNGTVGRPWYTSP